MSDDPTPYVRALAVEYQACRVTGQDGRILTVVEELTRHGWSYDDAAGELVRIAQRPSAKETAAAAPAVETPESPAPKRRAAPKE